MNEPGKSDKPIVPLKPANKGGGQPRPAEPVEGRGLAKGNQVQQNGLRTQCRDGLNSALDRRRMMPGGACVTTRGKSPVR